jgi:aspartyl-tRNA(Asn)/glutamyl-tRNA(Gln) amidotransferase subunit B
MTFEDTEYEAVIGLEVHLQLATESKIFASSSAKFGGEVNEYIDPVTLGMPGSLPVLNKKTVEYAVMLGLALKCEIRRESHFARKHYFYPDLPKGYQISQYDEPLCERGQITIDVEGSERTIGITRIHMEEDAGKNIHDGRTGCSLVDLNRAGVPLLEIVSEPDIRTAQEASQYLKTIRQIARFLGISDGNMEEGSLRCDANVSLRPRGNLKFGTRTEIKNLNSFKFVEKAIEYEIARQASVLRSGNKIVQATMLFDSTTNTTRVMRIKEDSADYRYFPDPDLPALLVEESWISKIKETMPKLPSEFVEELTKKFSLSEYDALVLTAERANIDYYFGVYTVCENPKAACNWITSELFGYLNKDGKTIESSPIKALDLGELIRLIDADEISGKMAKIVFEEMYASSKPPAAIISEKGLKQITDDSAIEQLVEKVLNDSTTQIAQYLGGNERLFGYFVGQAMKVSGGSANPKKVNDFIKAGLEKRRG